MNVYVIASSHRSRQKLHNLVGEGNHQEYYNLDIGYHLTEIPEKYLNDALEITGVRKGRFTDDWAQCWRTESVLGPSNG